MKLLEKAIGDLEDALECEDEALVIEGFMDRYHVSEQEAEQIFLETKKWLWLAAKASEEEEKLSLAIDKPLLVLDEMWHNFILYTRQYHRYCLSKFKKFIHHEPASRQEKLRAQQEMENNPTAAIEKWERSHYQQLSYIYDHLGAETVIKWYEELPAKYTPEYLASIKK